ncbi:hypothetical protein [Candidatus Nanohalovita haloferacivicina]|uniref:hypothetical protein n=1 Tax=Candidatus Nanohalovita haloferacivicina TaxID=2978046 RepID=UPI00325F9BBD|nr:hypothetical protein HBNXNv_0155 [Candidatus Nanohalobia archaeon BNXNv]
MDSEQDQLYVKLDGYRELLNDLDSVEKTITNIEEAMEVLRQVRSVKQTAIDTVNENIEHLNNELGEVAGQMPELEDNVPADELDDRQSAGGQQVVQQQSNDFGQEQSFSEDQGPELDNSIDELRDELDDLQNELSGLK